MGRGDEGLWGSMGGGGVSDERGGGASTTTAPNPPPQPSRHPTPPPTLKKRLKERFAFECGSDSDDATILVPKGPPPPHHHHHRTANEGRLPQTHQPPQDRHRPPPPPPTPTKTDTPKGCETTDDGPEDPIVGTVVHVPYPTGVERGTVRGIHGRKYGAVWVEYPGGTNLYEVARPLLFPTRRPSGTGTRPVRARKSPNPPPPQTKRLTPRTRTQPRNPLTPLTPHPDPRRHGTPLRGPMKCEGTGRGVYEKSDSVGVFEKPPPFSKMVCGGVLRVFLDADKPFPRKFFWWYSFGLHIQSFVLPPNSATFHVVPPL